MTVFWMFGTIEFASCSSGVASRMPGQAAGIPGATWSALDQPVLLLFSAMGKSAQFFLHLNLPV